MDVAAAVLAAGTVGDEDSADFTAQLVRKSVREFFRVGAGRAVEQGAGFLLEERERVRGPDVGAGAVAARCEEAGGGAFKSGGGTGLCLECSGRGWCGGHELRFLDGRGGGVGVKGRHAGAFDCLPFSVEGTQAVFIARRAEERCGGGAPLCAELGVVIADGV